MSQPDPHTEHDGLEVFFSKYLKDASMEPSARSWEMIDQALENGAKEKRRKRFLWFFFSGAGALLVLGSLLFLNYGPAISSYFNSGKPTAQQESKAPTSTQSQDVKEPNASSTFAPEQEAVQTPTKSEKLPAQSSTTPADTHEATAVSNALHVQLGAFRHRLKPGTFSKLPFTILSEAGTDGITRYYASIQNPAQDLETIRQNGFPDAFIKEGAIAAVAYQEEPVTSQAMAYQTQHQSKDQSASATPVHPTNPAATHQTNHSATNSAENYSTTPGVVHAPVSNTGSVSVVATTSESKAATANTVTSPGAGTTNSVSTSVANGATLQAVASDHGKSSNTADTNQVAGATAAVATTSVAAVDSVKKEPDKKDSTLTKTNVKVKDSTVAMPYARWAISITGGPTLLLNSPTSANFSVKDEYHPQTYNAHLEVEYRFLPKLSGGIGLSYQEYSTRRDETYFKFSKYISDDYQVQTSTGPIPIHKDILLQGYYMAAPIDSFFAYYTYASTQRILNVPLHVNWYFIDRSRIQAYAGLGVNAAYIVSQQNRVTLIKEHDRQDMTYNQVHANRFNALLLLSLGCDVRFSKRFYFTVAPTVRYGLTNTANTPGVLYKPFYLSGNAGLKIRF